jgi:sorbose reductase
VLAAALAWPYVEGKHDFDSLGTPLRIFSYAEAGANVIIWYNKNKDAEKRAEELEKEFSVKCRAFSVDVTNPEGVEKAITEQIKVFDNRLDVFVYNSGVAWTGE